MPLETVPGTDLTYHLVAFDGSGRERAEPDGTLSSRRVVEVLGSEPFTDVFVMSHGWMGDVPSARRQYNAWIRAMAGQTADLERASRKRAGFRPLLIGLHWPSLPFGDEGLGSEPSAPSFSPSQAPPLEGLIDAYADRLADSSTAREALRTIFESAQDNVAPDSLPPEVRTAYAVLDREAGLGSDGPGADPGSDRDPFDAERVYQAANEEVVSFGSFDLGGLLAPLRTLSYWKMKDRARRFGESSVGPMVAELQRLAPHARFHLIGHSFGCVVVSATLAGPGGRGTLIRPVDSTALLQGALSLWSYCDDIPALPGRPGYFRSVVADGRVRGPIITSQSEHDTAVGKWYPLASGVAGHVVFGPGELPKYGGLGTFGVRGPGPKVVDLEMLPADGAYDFRPGSVYNLESSRYISTMLDSTGGAHNDIDKPEVAHAVWSAVLAAE